MRQTLERGILVVEVVVEVEVEVRSHIQAPICHDGHLTVRKSGETWKSVGGAGFAVRCPPVDVTPHHAPHAETIFFHDRTGERYVLSIDGILVRWVCTVTMISEMVGHHAISAAIKK